MSRKRWEYMIIEGGTGLSGGAIRDASTDKLNQLGQQGWECYAVNNQSMPTIFYLKRER